MSSRLLQIQKKIGEKVLNNLFKQYGESEWSSVMTSHDNSRSNKNTIFPYSFFLKHSFYLCSKQKTYSFFFPSSFRTYKTPTKNHCFASFFISDLIVSRKWIILIYHSSYGKFLEAVNSQNPLCWIRRTSQVARNLIGQ